MSGVVLSDDVWEGLSLPAHLQFNFKLYDENDKFLGQSRDLTSLKTQFKKHLSNTLKAVATPDLERKDIQSWDFDLGKLGNLLGKLA